MLLSILLLQAASGGAGTTGGGGGQWSFWIMIIAIFAIMYLFMIRPQKKKQKEIEKFRKGLGVGNEVVTAGGIHGVIREVDDAQNTVVLEIDKGVKITIEKSSIYANAGTAAEAQAK